MPVQILSIDQVQFREWQHGERFAGKRGYLGRRLGARKLGYNVTSIPPGKCSYPYHCHRVNEEMFFVLAGEGEVRLADRTQAVRSGDVIACLAGGADTAHQIRNTSADTELKLLAASTNLTPEICEYPDSHKFGIYNETPADALFFIARGQAGPKDYWDGE